MNLKGVLFTTRIGLGFLRKNGKGVEEGKGDIVLVSSIAGWKECTGLVAYTASKHGVVGIMRGLHLSAVREGVRVNVVCPWMTSTPPPPPFPFPYSKSKSERDREENLIKKQKQEW